MIDNHEWPDAQEKHVYGEWMAKDKKTYYRMCVHPRCTASETMDSNTLEVKK